MHRTKCDCLARPQVTATVRPRFGNRVLGLPFISWIARGGSPTHERAGVNPWLSNSGVNIGSSRKQEKPALFSYVSRGGLALTVTVTPGRSATLEFSRAPRACRLLIIPAARVSICLTRIQGRKREYAAAHKNRAYRVCPAILGGGPPRRIISWCHTGCLARAIPANGNS